MALLDDVNALPVSITGGTTVGINTNSVVVHRALKDLGKLLGSSTFGASLVTAANDTAARGLLNAAATSHTHPTTAVVDLAEYIQDTVAGLLKAGSGVTTTYDDAANTFTINATTGGGSTDPEVVRDTIGGALVAGSGVSVTVNDAADTITIAVAGVPQSSVTGLTATIANLVVGQRNGTPTPTKLDILTEAQYQARVSAGTVDANTVYYRTA